MTKSIRVRRSAAIHVALPPERAFHYFTAEGEREWIDGWAPEFAGGDGEQARGTVFTTAAGGETTIWTVIESCRDSGRLLYSRVAPGSRAGLVEVRLTPVGEGTRAEIGYDLTALGEEGAEAVLAFDKGFDAMLEGWEARLADLVEPQPAL